MNKSILGRFYRHRRDIRKILDDIDIQLALLKRELHVFDRRFPDLFVKVERAQIASERRKAEEALSLLSEITLAIRQKPELSFCSHLGLNLQVLMKELSQHSANYFIQQSEHKLEHLFNWIKRLLLDIQRNGEGKFNHLIDKEYILIVSAAEDQLLEGFSEHDQPIIVEKLSLLAERIDAINRTLLLEKDHLLQGLRQDLVKNWNELITVVQNAFQQANAKNVIPLQTRTGIKQIALERSP